MINPEQDLWRSVALAAFHDELRGVRAGVRNGRTLDNAIQRAMTYFHSEDWRTITELAGIGSRPDRIRKVLRMGENCSSMHGVYAAFGMTMEE